MNYFNVMVGFTCLLQTAVAAYALRLNHFFGTARVGWSLFGAFATLAVLHLTQALGQENVRQGLGLQWSWSYLFISILLLIGLTHIEVVMRARGRAEAAERQVRRDLEVLVAEKTADLAKANQNLGEEIQGHIRSEALLEAANRQLQAALACVKRLNGLLPICCRCKKIRDDAGSWRELEGYISKHSEAQFSHGLCPECAQEFRKAMVEGNLWQGRS